ncbi:MAG: PKD domain-containing protein, partial [Bacteroidota bacterium]
MVNRQSWLKTLILSLILSVVGVIQVNAQAMVGKEFWFTLPQNSSDGPQQEYYIYVVSQYCIDSAYLELPFYGKTEYFSVEPGEFYKITVPNNNGGAFAYHRNAGFVENKGVHLVSPKPVSAYLLNYSQFTPDGETLIPMDKCGTNYVLSMRGNWVPGPNATYTPLENTVIATENNTSVKIDSWDEFGDPFNETVILNRGETYQWHTSADCSGDYDQSQIAFNCQASTGSKVVADKKVVCFSSNGCSNIGGCGNCDALMSTFLPVNNWSNHYVTSQVIQRNAPRANDGGCSLAGVTGSGDYVEIVGEVGAKVTVTSRLGVQNSTIVAPSYGSYGYGHIFFEIPAITGDNGEANTEIKSDKPVQVLQYTKGRSIDNNPSADPEALYVFSPDLWENSYFFYPIYTPTATNLEITVVVEDVGSPLPSTTILLNGVNVGAGGWISIPNTNYKFKRLADPEFISSRIESSSGAKFGFFFFARNERETAFFSGGYGPLANVSLCEQCADIDIVSKGSSCVNSPLSFEPKVYTFTVPSGLKYSWDFGDGDTSTAQFPNHAYRSFGRYRVNLKITNGTCVLNTSSIVQINDIDVSITPSDTLICPKTSVRLNSNPTLRPSDKVSITYTNATSVDIPEQGIPESWNNTSGNFASSVIVVNDNFSNPWTLDSVCFNIKHAKVRDVQVAITSPCGNTFKLARKSNTAGRANYRKTCFSPTAVIPFNSGLAPYTGSYIPVAGSGIWTSLQACNPKGSWTLRIGDDSVLVSGKLLDWSLHYSTTNSVNNFTWSPNYNISSLTSGTPVVSPAKDTTYYLTANDFNFCTARDSARIRVSRPPMVIPSHDTVLCSNSGIFNLDRTLNVPRDSSGFWTELTTSGRTVNGLFYIDSATTGDFIFRYRIPMYCGFDSATVRVRVNKLPNVGLPAVDSICNTNGPYALFNTLGGNPDTGGGFTADSLRGTSLSNGTFTPLNGAEATYFFYYKKPVQGCRVDSTQLQITLFRQRNPGISRDTTICETDTIFNLFKLLKGTPDVGGRWVDVNGSGKMTADGMFNPLGLVNGTYRFRYQFIVNNPCSDTNAVVTIRVNKAPYADLSTVTPKLCVDSLATVRIDLSGNGPFNLAVSDGTTTRNYNNTNGPIIFNPIIPDRTTFKIVGLTDRSVPTCSFIRPDSLTIQVYSPVQATLIKEECNADLSQFRAIVLVEGGDNTTYRADGVQFFGSTYTSPPIPNGSIYRIVFSDSTNCSVDVIDDKKYCECISEASALNLTLRQYCETDPASAVQLTAPVREPEDTVYWVLHDQSGISIGNALERRSDSTFAFKPGAPGYVYGKTYYISQIVGNAGDSLGLDRRDTCIDVSRGTPVRWNQLPGGTIRGNATICAGNATPLTLSLTGRAPFRVVLSINGVDSVLTGLSANTTLNVTPQDSTTYRLKSITDSNTPTCSVNLTDSARVLVNQLPTAVISGGTTICEGNTTPVVVRLTGSSPWRIDYTLNNVPQPQLVVFNSPFTLNASQQGTYKLTGVTDRNCTGRVGSELVEVKVSRRPVANAGEDFTNCGITARLNAVPSFGTGTWTGPGIFSDEHDPRAFVLVSGFGQYTFTWTEANSPCPNSTDQV